MFRKSTKFRKKIREFFEVVATFIQLRLPRTGVGINIHENLVRKVFGKKRQLPQIQLFLIYLCRNANGFEYFFHEFLKYYIDYVRYWWFMLYTVSTFLSITCIESINVMPFRVCTICRRSREISVVFGNFGRRIFQPPR